MIAEQGAYIGILGGGQLARMLCQAAGNLGYRTHIFCPESDPPAKQFSNRYTQAEYSDEDALKGFANACHVITCEFENVSAETLKTLSGFGANIAPSAQCFAVAQDRLVEKQYLSSAGTKTAPYRQIDTKQDCLKAFDDIGAGILKTRRLGYDGRGQHKITNINDIEKITFEPNTAGWIFEGLIDFSHEISVILTRGANGDIVEFPIPTNTHENGILSFCEVPTQNTGDAQRNLAVKHARQMANSLNYIGTIAVEFFITRTGDVLANEFAPRVHNSGHWTRELCTHDQFTLHILAITGQTLTTPHLISQGRMHNIIGDEVKDIPHSLPKGARLTLYGKDKARIGRKMGHYTIALPNGPI